MLLKDHSKDTTLQMVNDHLKKKTFKNLDK